MKQSSDELYKQIDQNTYMAVTDTGDICCKSELVKLSNRSYWKGLRDFSIRNDMLIIQVLLRAMITFWITHGDPAFREFVTQLERSGFEA